MTPISEAPLVSVVTPFYNSADHLAECIESVLAQTFEDFEYVILDNCSTDGSADVVRRYVERDPRIRFLSPDEHLPQRPNYNRVMRAISPASRYCKMVQADDWLHPECLSQMVAVAEQSARIKLVSSYRWIGDDISGGGLDVARSVFTGREVCRLQLLEGHFFFGSPTTVMYRTEDVLADDRFYDEQSFHEDTERCYELLSDGDMGFAHQVLSYCRVDPDSISGEVSDLNPFAADKLISILKYGPRYLDAAEFDACVRDYSASYYQEFVRGCLGPNRRAFRAYHRRTFELAGLEHSRSQIVRAAFQVAIDAIGNPKLNLGRAMAARKAHRSARISK